MDDVKHKWNQVSISEIVEFLEYKVENSEETDEEYGLYCDYKWQDDNREVFTMDENSKVVKALAKQIKHYNVYGV